MKENFERLTDAQIRAVLDSAPYCTLAVGSTPYAVPMFFTYTYRRGIFTFLMKSGLHGEKMQALHEKDYAAVTVMAKNGRGYDSIVAQGRVRLLPPDCVCRDKVEIELTAQSVTGRGYNTTIPCSRCEENAARVAAQRKQLAAQPPLAQESFIPPPPPVVQHAAPMENQPVRPATRAAFTPPQRVRTTDWKAAPLPPRPAQKIEEPPVTRPVTTAAPTSSFVPPTNFAAEEAARDDRAVRERQPERPAPKARWCESEEKMENLWRRYGERPRESIALKLEQAQPTIYAAGETMKSFSRVQKSDAAVWREKTGHIVFHKNGVYRLTMRLTEQGQTARLRLSLWCESSDCIVERVRFNDTGADANVLTAALVFDVSDRMYAFSLKNEMKMPVTLAGSWLFEKLK